MDAKYGTFGRTGIAWLHLNEVKHIVPLMKAESITELAAAEDRGTGVVRRA